MNKSELISRLSRRNTNLDYKKVEHSINCVLEQVSSTLEAGNRVEIRGFGSYNIKKHGARNSRNPRTGLKLRTIEKKVARFRPAKSLRERVNTLRDKNEIVK